MRGRQPRRRAGGAQREGRAAIAPGQRRAQEDPTERGVLGEPPLDVEEGGVTGIRRREPLGRRGELDLQQPRRVVARVERHHAAGDHAGQNADEHEDRDGGHLSDDHGPSQPTVAAGSGPCAAVLHHLAHVRTDRPQRDDDAERSNGDRDERPGAGDGHAIHLPDPPERHVLGHVGLRPARDGVEAPGGRGRADDAAGQAQKDAFPQTLHHQPGCRRPQRHPHGGLTQPLVGARGEERRDVEHRQQQDEAGGGVERGEDDRPLFADLRGREGLDRHRGHGAGRSRGRSGRGRCRRSGGDQVLQQRGCFGGRLRLRRVRREPAEERQHVAPRGQRQGGRRQRHPGILGHRETEATWHDTDDPRTDAVDGDDPAQRGRARREHQLPGAMRQDDHRLGAGRGIGCDKGPAEARRGAGHGEQHRIGHGRADHASVAVVPEQHLAPGVAAQVAHGPQRGAQGGDIGRVDRPAAGVLQARQPHDPLALGERQRPDHRRVQERERERAQAEPAGQDQDRQQGEAGTAGEQTERVADVLDVHPGNYAAGGGRLPPAGSPVPA